MFIFIVWCCKRGAIFHTFLQKTYCYHGTYYNSLDTWHSFRWVFFFNISWILRFYVGLVTSCHIFLFQRQLCLTNLVVQLLYVFNITDTSEHYIKIKECIYKAIVYWKQFKCLSKCVCQPIIYNLNEKASHPLCCYLYAEGADASPKVEAKVVFC